MEPVSVTHCDEDGDVEVGGFFHSFLMHPSLGKIICRVRLKLKLVQLEMLVSQMQKNGEAAHFKNEIKQSESKNLFKRLTLKIRLKQLNTKI